MGAAAARLGLRRVVHREHAVQHRHAGVERHALQSLRGPVGDQAEVLGLAADHDPEREHRVEAPGVRRPRRRDRQLVAARDPGELDVVGGNALALQRVERGVDETLHERLVPARGHDRETRCGHAHASPPPRSSRCPSLSRFVER